MRLLFVADGRSPTTLSWLQYWLDSNHEVHLLSTYPCESPSGLKSFHVIPVAFAGLARGQTSGIRKGRVSRFRASLLPLRYFLGPLDIVFRQKQFCRLVDLIRPDLIHALRIPFEGMLAFVASKEIPFLASIWGNDLTLHAHGSLWMGALTRQVLRRADGLLADAARDISLSKKWGLKAETPTMEVPGSGGLRLERFLSDISGIDLPEELPDGPLAVNPRGQRPGSLRQDIFFRAIPLVLESIPDAFFFCPSLQGDPQAEEWVASLGIAERARLWPKIDQAQLWKLMRSSKIFISPSVHDGTPNSLLEAMACGCLPVVGDIESMREWISDGVNGILLDATNVRSLADAIIRAIKDPVLHKQAAAINRALLEERADYTRNMVRVEEFYSEILKNKRL